MHYNLSNTEVITGIMIGSKYNKLKTEINASALFTGGDTRRMNANAEIGNAVICCYIPVHMRLM